MPSETTGLQAYTIECTLRGQSIVMNYNSRNLHMLLGSKAVVFFMPFFQGEQEAEMQKEVLKEPTYVEELLTLFRSNLGKEELLEKISDYHESDIADAMEPR